MPERDLQKIMNDVSRLPADPTMSGNPVVLIRCPSRTKMYRKFAVHCRDQDALEHSDRCHDFVALAVMPAVENPRS